MTEYHFAFGAYQILIVLIVLLKTLVQGSGRSDFAEVNRLIPCCPYQNMFKNGTCELDKNKLEKNLEYPARFRNWTTNFTLQCESGYAYVDVDGKAIGGNLHGLLFNISSAANSKPTPYCIDSMGDRQLNMIICQTILKCTLSETCTKKCCPPNSFLIQTSGNMEKSNKNNGNLRCGSSRARVTEIGHSFGYNATTDVSVTKSSNLNQLIVLKKKEVENSGFAHRPNCKDMSIIETPGFIVREDGSTIILKKNPNHAVEIWLSLGENDFCVDAMDENWPNLVLIYCEEAMQEEIGKIHMLLKSFLQDKFTAATKSTGAISILSAIFLSISLIVYGTLWREHNIHGWIQFSFLLALFCTYFVAGLRRLIGYEVLVESGLAPLFEALEDFGAVSASANLVAISFDLFLILWKSTPTFSKREGLTQCIVVIVLSWSTGIIVMAAGLIIKSGKKYTILPSELSNLKEYLPKLLEFFLCIQNDMLFSICLPIVQLGLFTLNLILFVGSAIVLYKRKVETQMAFENFAKNQVFKFWVQRFAKLFLLMGLWWPMIVICVFECNSMLKYTTQVWTQVLNTFYKKPSKVDFEIPWHMYLISNLLAFQAVVTSILFVCNRKTWNALKKTSPISRFCYENIE